MGGVSEVLIPIIFIILLPIYIIWVIRAKSPSYKGARGEQRVAKKLKKLDSLDPEKYKILNNVMLKTSRGSSQIDHVVVSIYGIFVIETKNFSGWIFGNEKAEQWTQTIYNEKNKFRNPVKQNWAHVYALKEILSAYRGIKYHPIVAFTGSCELKSIKSNIPVVYSKELPWTIINQSIDTCISMEQVEAIVERLNVEDSIAPSLDAHKKQVRLTIQDRMQKEKTLVCPNCGSDLKIRKGKYGKFYGCSNYPKCKYTRKY
jgi:hypothetical protein